VARVKQKIQIALLLDSVQVPAWVYRAVELVLESDKAEVALLVLNERSSAGKSDWRELFESAVYRLYRKLDEKLGNVRESPFQICQLDALLPGVKTISVRPEQTRFSDRISERDCLEIRKAGIDVAVRFGFRILRGEILNSTKYGVWSYHHGDSHVNRGGPPGFWEVMGRWPVTGATLQILSEQLDGGQIISQTFSTTHPTFVSRSKCQLYWSSAPLLSRAIVDLQRSGGAEFFLRLKRKSWLKFYSRPLYQPPRNTRMLVEGLAHFGRLVQRKVRRVSRTANWDLYFCYQPSGALSTELRRFKPVPAGSNDRSSRADPFLVYSRGTHFLFYEEIKSGKGSIACLTYSENEGWSKVKTVLQREYHLSYPFVFEYQGDYFMIPETAENRTIELYRATHFPERWELEKILMPDVSARDTTLLYRDGLWWMFTCVQEHPEVSSCQELFLFSTDELLEGEWQAHPLNPIVSDVGSARPAGRFLELEGRLYRPSQNCGGQYGTSIKLNLVSELSRDDYSELCVDEIRAEWRPQVQRIHTLNFCHGMTVVDTFIQDSEGGHRV